MAMAMIWIGGTIVVVVAVVGLVVLLIKEINDYGKSEPK